AGDAARAAGGLAPPGGDVAVYAHLLTGDVARRRGDLAAARAAYDAAGAGGGARLHVLAARAELALAEGDRPGALVLAAEAAPLATSADDRARVAAIRAHADPRHA